MADEYTDLRSLMAEAIHKTAVAQGYADFTEHQASALATAALYRLRDLKLPTLVQVNHAKIGTDETYFDVLTQLDLERYRIANAQ